MLKNIYMKSEISTPQSMSVICYARVSSLTQDLDLQTSELKKFCDYRSYTIARMFTDKASGKNLERTGFQDMINLLDKNTMDIKAVVIYKLDRIGRSLTDLLRIVEYLKAKNIQLISITDNIDTTTAQGVLFFQLIGAFAEYERKLINERTSAGLAEAKANGVKFGRPEKIIPMDAIDKDIAMGLSKSAICRKYGTKRSTLYMKLNERKNNVKI
jgi:DNA invertase Pin-like site-specific DNA recombinase